MTRVMTILGSTGSIGTQSLEVALANNIEIYGLTANRNVKLVEQQARQFNPKVVAMANEAAAKDLSELLADTSIKVLAGMDGVVEVASSGNSDTVLNSIVGIAGLRPTLRALENGKNIALANKETLVTGGKMVMQLARDKNLKILPVDSEHSAIFQCLQGAPEGSLQKIILTASGGPFFGKTKEEIECVPVSAALKHPNWDMGAKITIDSATLMNKGLEVIEAVHLFGVAPDDIEVVVHRQSIIHSAVELSDGSVIAQLGLPDMKLPIQYALTYPQRAGLCTKRLSLTDIGTLTFDKPDMEAFGCLKVCIDAINAGGLKPCAANGANEQAVALYLDNKIKFGDIARLVRAATDNQPTGEVCEQSVFDADAAAREFVISHI